MKGFFRETFHTIRLNLLRLAAFSICWRLAAGLGLWKLTGLLLRFSLRSAGYSYLTMSNLFPALVNPAAVLSAILLVVLLAAAMTVELAALITIYQAASYSRKAGLGAIAAGAFSKTWEQMGRRNWRLFLLALASYLMMNCYVLLRVFTRIRPINFVMEELLNIAAGRLFLVLLVAGLALVGVPTMMVFFTCMVEQKNFRDGLRRSRSLIKGKWPGAVLRLFALNGIVLLGMAVLHVVLYLGAAAVAALFEEGYRATAVLLAVSGRIEAVVLFLGSTIATAVDFGGLTVMYGRFAGKDAVRSTAVPASGPVLGLSERGRRRGLAILAAGVALSGLLTADLIWNGSGLEAALLADTEITAHRGSSRRAPENTLPALEAAIEEMADFCEIDVQTTSDGVIVVCHDLNVKRVSGVNRRLGKMTWDEVQKLDVGSFMGQEFAGVGIPALEEMLEAAREGNWGELPQVLSGYRTQEEQEKLFQEEIDGNLAEGYSEEEARELAQQWVAVPGTSEHQLGLAVDLGGATYDVFFWLQEHSWEYGFIWRYPGDKTDLTGTAEEVWHYRYVGKEAAKEIYEQGVCLEEYLEQKKEENGQ